MFVSIESNVFVSGSRNVRANDNRYQGDTSTNQSITYRGIEVKGNGSERDHSERESIRSEDQLTTELPRRIRSRGVVIVEEEDPVYGAT